MDSPLFEAGRRAEDAIFGDVLGSYHKKCVTSTHFCVAIIPYSVTSVAQLPRYANALT